MMTADSQLLRDYVREKSQDAFAELVRRHLDLVYSAALRQVRSSQLAEEVSQSVFADLARAADQLKPDTILTAWLYQVARRTAIDVVRRESRRQARERLAVEMAAMNTTTDWAHIEPLLDDAMDALEETDRAAILLRYFENKSLREVGESLGTSDDAAQKRVSRAVERLREFFSKRGVAIGTSGLVVLVSVNAVHAAPLALAATISSAAVLAGTTIQTSTTIAATKAIAMTTLQKALVTATVAVLAGAGAYEARQNSNLHGQIETLQQQQAPLSAQLQQLQNERDDAVRRLAALIAENEQLKLNQDKAEVLRLRSEVAQFKAMETDPFNSRAKDWLNKVDKLKQRLEESPRDKIPELQYLSEKDWLDAASPKLETDTDYRRALADLRHAGEDKFASMATSALKKYYLATDNHFPTDVSQLKPFFDPPVDDATIDRWTVVSGKNIGFGGDAEITQKSAVDDILDWRVTIGYNGYGDSSDFLDLEGKQIMGPVYSAYKAANNGYSAENPSELLSYATTPEQQTLIRKLMERAALPK